MSFTLSVALGSCLVVISLRAMFLVLSANMKVSFNEGGSDEEDVEFSIEEVQDQSKARIKKI